MGGTIFTITLPLLFFSCIHNNDSGSYHVKYASHSTMSSKLRSSYNRAARCSQYDCAARYIPHTKTVVMLAIYYHCLSIESKYTDQVYLDLCLFIPAVKNTGIPNSLGCHIPCDTGHERATEKSSGHQLRYRTFTQYNSQRRSLFLSSCADCAHNLLRDARA